MRKTTIVKTSLLLLAAIMIMPSAFAQNRKLQTKTINTKLFGMPAKQTGSYYIDNAGEMVIHGKMTVTGSMSNSRDKASATLIITYKDGEPIGPVSVTYSINNLTGKMSGQMDEAGMSGTWNVVNGPGTNKTKSASFTIKDRRIVKLNATGYDGTIVDFSSDAQGKLTGTGTANKVIAIKSKNGIVTNYMINKNGKTIYEFSSNAKTMIDELTKREVSPGELTQNGFYLDENSWKDLNLYDAALHAVECFSEEVPMDDGLAKPNYCAVLCEIKDSQYASFAECKMWLDNAKNSGLDKLDELADNMIESYTDGQGHYLKPEVAQQVKEYKSAAKDSWIKETINTINRMDNLGNLKNFIASQSKNIKLLPEEKQNQLAKASSDKENELLSEMKTSIEKEIDYSALLNYYNTKVLPSKEYLKQKDSESINTAFNKKKAELEKTASAKIVDEISRQESTKGLKQYYDGIQPVVKSFKDSSSIQSAYDSKYSALEKAEQKAAKKAARKQKIITGAKWVGGAAVVVGGYFLVKHFGLLDK